MEFDEQKAIEFINLRLTEAGRKPYDEDEVFNIIDMIWDYYQGCLRWRPIQITTRMI